MSIPIPTEFSSELYEQLAPIARFDPEHGYATLCLCVALGGMFDPIDDLVSDRPEGPGYSKLVDLWRVREDALPWLGQFVGVQVPPSYDLAGKREFIDSTGGFVRGRPSTILGAAQTTLTGNKTAFLNERYTGDAYRLQLVTFTAETPNPAATLAAAQSQTPATILLTHDVRAGQTWQNLVTEKTNWQAVVNTYATWQSAVDKIPI